MVNVSKELQDVVVGRLDEQRERNNLAGRIDETKINYCSSVFNGYQKFLIATYDFDGVELRTDVYMGDFVGEMSAERRKAKEQADFNTQVHNAAWFIVDYVNSHLLNGERMSADNAAAIENLIFRNLQGVSAY